MQNTDVRFRKKTEDGGRIVKISDLNAKLENTDFRSQISDLRIPTYVSLGELRRASRFKYINAEYSCQISEEDRRRKTASIL